MRRVAACVIAAVTALVASRVSLALPQQGAFRSSIDVVLVPVSVTDRNRPVAGLIAADFELLDNGVKQTISLQPVDALPTDVTFLVDTSGSVNGRALDRIRTDLQEMADLLQPNDRVRAVAFARDATDVFGFKPGGAPLDLTRMTAGGTTSLYDALVTVLAASPSGNRPHLVFAVTDGRDNSSFTSAPHVVRVAAASGAVLCVVLVPSSNPLIREGGNIDAVDPMATEQSAVVLPGQTGSNIVAGSSISMPGESTAAPTTITRNAGPYAGGPNRRALDEAAAVTGGIVTTDSSRTPIPQVFRRVLDDFRAGYVLSYTPTGVERGGTHQLTVRTTRRGLTVRARRSYEER
jgi:VWFA-related protein